MENSTLGSDPDTVWQKLCKIVKKISLGSLGMSPMLPVGEDQLVQLDQVDVDIVISLHHILAVLTSLVEPPQQQQGLYRQVGICVYEGLLVQKCNRCLTLFEIESTIPNIKVCFLMLKPSY